MGDLATHGSIAKKVISVLKKNKFLHKKGEPKLNYEYFELGNFLTDVSQLRDIYSWTSAKIAVWNTAREEHGPTALRFVEMHKYLEKLLGKPGVHGVLPQFLRELAFIIGNEKFVNKKTDALPFKEYKRIFRDIEKEKKFYKGFTQYWPHEHLDFPLFFHGNIIGHRTKSSVNAHTCDPKKKSTETRKLYKHLELQIEFCVELLTSLEHMFRNLHQKKNTRANEKERNEMLALFGHVCHTIEDYWFHSNFVDKAWSRLNKPLPGSDNKVRWHRMWLRRLRQPTGTDHNSKLSTKKSEFDNLAITGSFGDKDVFFTLMDIMKSQKKNLKGMPLIIFNIFFDAGTRKRIFERTADGKAYKNKDDREKFFKKLRDFVNNPDKYMPTTGRQLHPESKKTLKKMCATDKKIYDKYSDDSSTLAGIPDDICGPFAFMIELLAKSDREVQASKKRSKELDRIATPVTVADMKNPDGNNEYIKKAILPTDNGAGREVLGSHSLINKDNATKRPLFPQALNIASHLSCYIAKLLIGQVKKPKIPSARFHDKAKDLSEHGAENIVRKPKYIDWLHLLHHFLCHPDECENDWHIKMMQDEKSPNHHIVHYINSKKAKELMKLVRREHLKQMYKNLESSVETQWKKLKNE